MAFAYADDIAYADDLPYLGESVAATLTGSVRPTASITGEVG